MEARRPIVFGFALLVVLLCSPTFAAENPMLRHLAQAYPLVFQSPLQPVAATPLVSPQDNMKLLINSYQGQSSYEEMAAVFKSDVSNNIKSKPELDSILAANELSENDFNVLLGKIAESPSLMAEFLGYLKANPKAQELIKLKQEIPQYDSLLPTDTHRKVFREVIQQLQKTPAASSEQQLPRFQPVWTFRPILPKAS